MVGVMVDVDQYQIQCNPLFNLDFLKIGGICLIIVMMFRVQISQILIVDEDLIKFLQQSKYKNHIMIDTL